MDVETVYRRRIARLTAPERMRRAEQLMLWSRDVIRRDIIATRGPLPETELRAEIALRVYGSDPRVRDLIESWRRRVAG